MGGRGTPWDRDGRKNLLNLWPLEDVGVSRSGIKDRQSVPLTLVRIDFHEPREAAVPKIRRAFDRADRGTS